MLLKPKLIPAIYFPRFIKFRNCMARLKHGQKVYTWWRSWTGNGFIRLWKMFKIFLLNISSSKDISERAGGDVSRPRPTLNDAALSFMLTPWFLPHKIGSWGATNAAIEVQYSIKNVNIQIFLIMKWRTVHSIQILRWSQYHHFESERVQTVRDNNHRNIIGSRHGCLTGRMLLQVETNRPATIWCVYFCKMKCSEAFFLGQSFMHVVGGGDPLCLTRYRYGEVALQVHSYTAPMALHVFSKLFKCLSTVFPYSLTLATSWWKVT